TIARRHAWRACAQEDRRSSRSLIPRTVPCWARFSIHRSCLATRFRITVWNSPCGTRKPRCSTSPYPGRPTTPTERLTKSTRPAKETATLCPPPAIPAGLALAPRQQLFTSCGDVIDVPSGQVVTTITNVGADEIWFNPGEERVYYGGFQAVKVPIVDTD